MMLLQILKFVDSPKTQKLKCFENENIFPSNKKKQFYIKSYNMAQNSFPIEVKTFNNLACLKNYQGKRSRCLQVFGIIAILNQLYYKILRKTPTIDSLLESCKLQACNTTKKEQARMYHPIKLAMFFSEQVFTEHIKATDSVNQNN